MKTRRTNPTEAQPATKEAGFSLLEMVIGMALLTELMILGYVVFDVNTKVARVQADLAELQQSQRVANYDLLRNSRMAGRGGLRSQAALQIDNDVDSDAKVGDNDVVEGSDILTIRGALSTPIWTTGTKANSWSYDVASQVGTLILESTESLPQDFGLLQEADDDNLPLAILISTLQDPSLYAVFEVQNISIASVDLDGSGTVEEGEERATVTVSGDPSDGTHNSDYLELSTGGSVPNALANTTDIAWAGILEEFRYYIRDDADAVTGASRKLSRAQFYPNTDTLYRGDTANGRVDIADNVVDLQLALSLDTDGSGDISEDPSNKKSDEWLFNHSEDSETDDLWGIDDADAGWAGATPFQLLVSTMVLSEEIDGNYRAEYTPWHLDHEVDDSPSPSSEDERKERQHRRRIMESIVDLRNVS